MNKILYIININEIKKNIKKIKYQNKKTKIKIIK